MTASTTQGNTVLPVDLLRSCTRTVHQRLHGHAKLGLMVSDKITVQIYQWFLAKHYGFYRGFQLASAPPPVSLAPYLAPSVEWLAEDLHNLGVSVGSIPLCRLVPAPAREAEWLGFIYVKEGSLLGGQVMLKNLRQHLPESATAQRYLSAHGSDNGMRWRQVCSLLNTRLQSGGPLARQSALQTFSDLELWLE